MDNALDQYTLFYRALVRFENEFVSKVKPNCPVPLWNVRKIHLIIQPEDEDFAQNRIERVVKRIYLVLGVTQKVLAGIGPHVRPGELWWVRAKSRSLGVFASIVHMSLVNLPFDNNDDVMSGVGGLNFVDIETKRLIDNGLCQEIVQLVNVFN